MKNVLQLLFADPDLVTRDLVNDVLAYKRLDGVDEALRTVADRVFPGRRQAKVLNLSGSDVPILAVWGSEDDVSASLPAGHPTIASISSTGKNLGADGGGGYGEPPGCRLPQVRS